MTTHRPYSMHSLSHFTRWLLMLLSMLTTASVVQAQSIPLASWVDYSDSEKEALKSRWTPEQVDAVVAALAGGLALPDFVAKLPPAGGGMVFGDDLRGISLNGAELRRADLSYAYLQGAYLFGAVLEGADLTEANLEGAYLRGTDLTGARFGRANLAGANLESAKMQDADLTSADLRNANLSSATMVHATLTSANLRGAILTRTDLRQANMQNCAMPQAVMREADLQDADLFQAQFDSTYLYQVQLGKARNIRDIRWGDSVYSRYFIGEELSLKTSEDFRRAEVTYRDLKMLYRRELLDDIANEFHFRENEIITNNYPWLSPVRILRLLFLKWTFGYGARPMWLLWYSMVVVGGFSLIFALLTLSKRTQSGICEYDPAKEGKETLLEFRNGRLFFDCFYFSLLSLATFGYGALQPRQWLQFFRFQPVEYKPIRWACIFVGIEAGLGIWIFSLLVTVLFGSR
jgi:uncharacterized protein YjbI with pentapeptide repeats